MTGDELEKAARVVRASGDVALLDRICDATTSYRTGFLGVGGSEAFRGGASIERSAGVDRLVRMKLVRYQRGKAIATARGFSVSTRLIAMKAQHR